MLKIKIIFFGFATKIYIYSIFSLALSFKIFFRIIKNLIKLKIGIFGTFVKLLHISHQY
jgi:hypothetical protein